MGALYAGPTGERVWSMGKNGNRVDAELRGHREWGWDPKK
jgi:hypothetical protein